MNDAIELTVAQLRKSEEASLVHLSSISDISEVGSACSSRNSRISVEPNSSETNSSFENLLRFPDETSSVNLKDAGKIEQMLDKTKIEEMQNQLDWYKWQEKTKNGNSSSGVKNIYEDILRALNQGEGLGLLVSFMEIMQANHEKTDKGYLIDADLFNSAVSAAAMGRSAISSMEEIATIPKLTPVLQEISVESFYSLIWDIVEECRAFESIKQTRLLISDQPLHCCGHVKISPELFSKALRELVINAMKFSSRGNPVIVIFRSDRDGVELCILNDPMPDSDGNRGIPRQYESMLFEPFFRLNKTVQVKFGTLDHGLGLSLADGIIKKHGGSLEITTIRDYSFLGKGLTSKVMARVYLPLSFSSL